MAIQKKAHPLASDPVTVLPGIGVSLGEDLNMLGVHTVGDLVKKSPQELYDKLSKLTSSKQDPCVLYTFRCAVYAAQTENPKKELLLWWNWKDRDLS